jgi:hypothetical protein
MAVFVKAYWKVILVFVLVGLVGGFFTGLFVLDSYPDSKEMIDWAFRDGNGQANAFLARENAKEEFDKNTVEEFTKAMRQ